MSKRLSVNHTLFVIPSVLAILIGLPILASTSQTDKGVAAYNAGEYREAIKLLGDAKATDFTNPLLHYYLANALLKLGAKESALKEYKLARDLQPDGQMADYCEAAIQKLSPPLPKSPAESGKTADDQSGKSTSASTTKENEASSAQSSSTSSSKTADGGKPSADAGKSASPEAKPASQKPQVFCYLCGCPLCHRVELMITDLHTKYGDQITFIRTMRNTMDEATSQIMQKYNVHECPTVLLFDNHGKKIQEYTEVISEEQVCRDLAALAKTSEFTRLSGTLDKRLAGTRNAIVSEVYARLAADRLRLDNEINELADPAPVKRIIRWSFSKRTLKKERMSGSTMQKRDCVL